MGGGIGMGNTRKSMAVSFQCMTKSTTNKKRKKITLEFTICQVPCEVFHTDLFNCHSTVYWYSMCITCNNEKQDSLDTQQQDLVK